MTQLGYKWEVHVRTVPKNGPEESFDLGEVFTDGRGPVSVRPDYKDLGKNAANVNQSLVRNEQGLRVSVSLRFEVVTMADANALATIAERLTRSDWTVYLSLDGGITERVVEIDRMYRPEPLGGKTYVGARFTLNLVCVDTIQYPPAMFVPPLKVHSQLRDGGLEQWDDATTPTIWLVTPYGGSVNRDSGEAHGGQYCARLDRTVGGELSISQSRTLYRPGKWYLVEFWAKASTALTNGAGLRINNTTQATFWNGHEWSVSSAEAALYDLTTSWTKFTHRFRRDSKYSLSDATNILLRYHDTGAGESVYFDDVRVIGPVRPPDVSAW